MENCTTFGGRIGLVWLCLGIFLVLFQNAAAKENKIDPTDNLNLATFSSWISAYDCLNKTAPIGCSAKGQLTDKGTVDVAANEVGEYCSLAASGCARHVIEVLKCVYLCKTDFWFANNATVLDLFQTIIDGCANHSSAFSNVNQKYDRNSQQWSKLKYVALFEY